MGQLFIIARVFSQKAVLHRLQGESGRLLCINQIDFLRGSESTVNIQMENRGYNASPVLYFGSR